MARDIISKKQREILDYIKEQIVDKGFPPSVREICEAVHLKSTSSVHAHLNSLEKHGFIRRDPAKPRCIEIVDDSFSSFRRNNLNVPILGTVTAGLPILAVENYELRHKDLRKNKHIRSDITLSLTSSPVKCHCRSLTIKIWTFGKTDMAIRRNCFPLKLPDCQDAPFALTLLQSPR